MPIPKLEVEYGKFEATEGGTYPFLAVLTIEARRVGYGRQEVIGAAVRDAQNQASRFVGNGECLTQQLATAQRESRQGRDALVDEREKVRALRLKVRRLQREVKTLRAREEGRGDGS